MKRILFIAPYSPSGSLSPALGAAKKIRMLVSACVDLGYGVEFFNSAANTASSSWISSEQHFPGVGETPIPTLVFRPRSLCRCMSIFFLPLIGVSLALIRRPSVVWVYNMGAGEMLFGWFAANLSGAKLVVEVEDLPDARLRGLLDLKPKIDWFFARYLLRRVDCFLFVSDSVRSVVHKTKSKYRVIQGLVNTVDVDSPRELNRIGYFGGLNEEKGASILVELIRRRSGSWSFSICGVGPLSSTIRELIDFERGDVFFDGAPDSVVEREKRRCSVLINPHSDAVSLRSGVFPFKLIEYLNSSAVILTTDMGFDSSWTTHMGVFVISPDFDEYSKEIYGRGLSGRSLPVNVLAARRIFLQQFRARIVVEDVLSGVME